MNLGDMIRAINRRVDDSVLTEDAIEWLNSGQNILASEVGASFPQLQMTTDLTDTFVFPEKFHHIPVLYACARFKEQDGSIVEAQHFHAQFEQAKVLFTSSYDVPPMYRDDHLSEQFIAVANQDTFTITKNSYNPSYGDLKVYVNNQLRTDVVINMNKTFFLPTPCQDGDRVTAVWEEHSDLIEPPYNWWGW